MRRLPYLLAIGFSSFAFVVACTATGTTVEGVEAPSGSAPNGGSDPAATNTPTENTVPVQADPTDVEAEQPWNPPTETGAVSFPYTAYRCGYPVRQVSPSKPAATFHATTPGGATAPKNLHLTIAGNASSSVVVQWSTDAQTTETEVRFGDSPTNLDKIAHGYSFSYVNGRRQHEVHLCGLAAGRTYYYDAGGGAARGAVYKFTTAPDAATDVKVLVAGDTRSNPSVWGSMESAALAKGPTVLLLSGDAVATGDNQGQWDALFAAAPELWASIPTVWAHGNHEALEEPYFAQLALPDNGGSAGIEEWFAMTYGPLRVVVLNDTVSSSAQIAGVERTFLDTSLKAVDRARTPFVVTMHHKPMYTTSSGHSSDTGLRAAWMPLFDTHHVNLDIAGHVHSYESTLPILGSAGQTTTDAQGTRFFNFGGGGAPLYSFGSNQPWIKTRESTYGFALMTVTPNAIDWTAFRQDGSQIESIAIPK